MSKKFAVIFLIISLVVFGLALTFREQIRDVFAAQSDKVRGWAWSSNVGWFSFNCYNDYGGALASHCKADDPLNYDSDYGVDVDTNPASPNYGQLSGYAWASTIGYITFNQGQLGGCPGGACQAWVDFTDINCGPPNNQCPVYGWARACAVFQAGCAGALDPNRGGWDGWVKLRGQTNPPVGPPEDYGAHLNMLPGNIKEFGGWAWGGDPDSLEEAVIGWVSFNGPENCDKDSGGAGNGFVDVDCGGDNATDVITDYKVLGVFNLPPEITALDVEPCANPCSSPAVQFSWTYFDADSDPQAKYWLEVDKDSNWGTTLAGEYASPPAGEVSGAPNRPLSLEVPGDGPADLGDNRLDYNRGYRWRVKVEDSAAPPNGPNQSDWYYSFNNVPSKDFTSCNRPGPRPDFQIFPPEPAEDEIIQFCAVEAIGTDCDPVANESECFNSANLSALCPAAMKWLITPAAPGAFTCLSGCPLGDLFNDPSDPTGKFTEDGTHQAELQINDSVLGETCSSGLRPLDVSKPLPHWIERKPEG